ncbi:MAG: type VI secretion system amidase effector protein Tae4 [Bacteroidota bacterium]
MTPFQTLWDKHPGSTVYPCCQTSFPNQCAIRMGVALLGAGFTSSSFTGLAKCWLKHSPKHILRAQELADWVGRQRVSFGKVQVYKKKDNITSAQFTGKKGIVFFKDFWGNPMVGDHIDLWDGISMKAGSSDYFSRAAEVWFWELK